MLHYDLFAEGSDSLEPRDRRFPRFRSPLAAAAIALGLYIALYLTVAAVVHVLAVPDASAVTPGRSTERAMAAAASTSAAHVDESSAADSPERPSKRTVAGLRAS